MVFELHIVVKKNFLRLTKLSLNGDAPYFVKK